MAPGFEDTGGNSAPGGPGTILRTGEKSTVPLSKTRLPWSSKWAVLAPTEANVSLAEKFRPSSAATSESSTSLKMYQTFFPLPFICPKDSGMVMVPFATSIWPVSSNCTGPTKLRLVEEGGGPKSDSGTAVPMAAGGGETLHPGAGPGVRGGG